MYSYFSTPICIVPVIYTCYKMFVMSTNLWFCFIQHCSWAWLIMKGSAVYSWTVNLIGTPVVDTARLKMILLQYAGRQRHVRLKISTCHFNGGFFCAYYSVYIRRRHTYELRSFLLIVFARYVCMHLHLYIISYVSSYCTKFVVKN
jgi:hypothetical protein